MYLAKFGKESLQRQVETLDPETVPEERRSKARAILNKFSEELISKVSLATVLFYNWVIRFSYFICSSTCRLISTILFL